MPRLLEDRSNGPADRLSGIVSGNKDANFAFIGNFPRSIGVETREHAAVTIAEAEPRKTEGLEISADVIAPLLRITGTKVCL